MKMNDKEYTQDEGETVDLVVWEEWVNSILESDLPKEMSHLKDPDGACESSQRD
jgi:hypothetical protein